MVRDARRRALRAVHAAAHVVHTRTHHSHCSEGYNAPQLQASSSASLSFLVLCVRLHCHALALRLRENLPHPLDRYKGQGDPQKTLSSGYGSLPTAPTFPSTAVQPHQLWVQGVEDKRSHEIALQQLEEHSKEQVSESATVSEPIEKPAKPIRSNMMSGSLDKFEASADKAGRKEKWSPDAILNTAIWMRAAGTLGSGIKPGDWTSWKRAVAVRGQRSINIYT